MVALFGPRAVMRAVMLTLSLSAAMPTRAQAPEAPFSEVFAQLAARLVGVVVNISTTQVTAAPVAKGAPEAQVRSPGTPLYAFFLDFFSEKGKPGGPHSPSPRPASLSAVVLTDDTGLSL